jgi:U4/U6.U5 tri-snRNP-associated protein 1
MADEPEEISVEETNRIRISLGLKPLALSNDTPDEQDPEKNYQDARDAQALLLKQSKLKASLEKARNKRLLHTQLPGSTLADDDDDTDASTLDWIKRVKINGI